MGNYRPRPCIQISLQAARKHKPDFSGACHTSWWVKLAEISAHTSTVAFKGSPCASAFQIQGTLGPRGGAGACSVSGVRGETRSRLSIPTGFDYSQSPSHFSHTQSPKKALFPKEQLLAQPPCDTELCSPQRARTAPKPLFPWQRRERISRTNPLRESGRHSGIRCCHREGILHRRSRYQRNPSPEHIPDQLPGWKSSNRSRAKRGEKLPAPTFPFSFSFFSPPLSCPCHPRPSLPGSTWSGSCRVSVESAASPLILISAKGGTTDFNNRSQSQATGTCGFH